MGVPAVSPERPLIPSIAGILPHCRELGFGPSRLRRYTLMIIGSSKANGLLILNE
jgi:hypothetical protein